MDIDIEEWKPDLPIPHSEILNNVDIKPEVTFLQVQQQQKCHICDKLFDNLEVTNPSSGYAEYQLAAYAGTFRHPELCIARYQRCRTPITKLREIIKVQ